MSPKGPPGGKARSARGAPSALGVLLEQMPLVAVLRGITPPEIDAIGSVLAAAGFRILEVTLNSPQPFESIRRLADGFGDRCLVGAGTVTSPDEVTQVRAAGGRLIVMPHSDAAVIREAARQGMVCLPGVATPTEAFAALAAGADALKLFPAEQLPPAVLKAWRAVLPGDALLLPVGGIAPATMAPYWAAGARGFGTGSNLYRPGASVEAVRAAAAAFAVAAHALPRDA